MTLKNEILSLLRTNGPMFRPHITQSTGASSEAVMQYLKELQKAGKVKTCGKGRIKKWRVAA